ncbi:MAG: hemerythrin domain-containing protein [Deltaproteobacteria bacterium]|nr:hemerythrin domain-containing protein [Deltaproteobacteria bacterium]
MEEYLNKGIKEVITESPEVGKILDEYGIGCGPCNVGTCLLKDIVEIHGLSVDEEQDMMVRIAKIIYPDKVVKMPQIRRKAEAEPKEIKFSPPMKALVDEHVLIKRWVALIPEVVKNLDLESEEGRQLVLNGVDFIQSYADKYHHAKEEEILFKYFDENLDILKAMHEDHTQARGHVKAILEAIERKDKASVAERLTAYAELLTEHIKKEDEILYPWMDRNLSITHIGKLYSKFKETDAGMVNSPKKYEAFINNLEKKSNNKEGKTWKDSRDVQARK